MLGFERRGFFIPYRYADQVPARRDRASYVALEPLFSEAEPTFLRAAQVDGPLCR